MTWAARGVFGWADLPVRLALPMLQDVPQRRAGLERGFDALAAGDLQGNGDWKGGGGGMGMLMAGIWFFCFSLLGGKKKEQRRCSEVRKETKSPLAQARQQKQQSTCKGARSTAQALDARLRAHSTRDPPQTRRR